MLERKSKVTEEVGEEKQSERGCQMGNAKWQMMFERKSKVTEDDREEKQS